MSKGPSSTQSCDTLTMCSLKGLTLKCKLPETCQQHWPNNRALCPILTGALKHPFQEMKEALLLCPFTPPILQMEKQAQGPEATPSESYNESVAWQGEASSPVFL